MPHVHWVEGDAGAPAVVDIGLATPRRNVSRLIPSCGPTASAAAVTEPYSGRWSRTIRTALDLISGSNFLGMSRPPPQKEAASNPGRFTVLARRVSLAAGLDPDASIRGVVSRR